MLYAPTVYVLSTDLVRCAEYLIFGFGAGGEEEARLQSLAERP